jgi:HAD superfamily hydrolase (TIGR01509 family)
MALDAVIFDLDGTLIDTNAAHVEAWRRAFEACGYKVPPDRIAVEIGKGGDFLVAAVLGPSAEREHGERLGKLSAEAFLDVAAKEHFRLMPGAEELLGALRQGGLKLALATSSKVKHLKATWDSLGFDLSERFDVVINADDAARTKPAPDLVHAALDKLGLFAAQCAMVGDTPYDGQACAQAGVACLAVLCGGNSAEPLRRAGARGVWRDPTDLAAHLEDALRLASPGPTRWTRQWAEALMREALAAAREGVARGEWPDGCVLAGADGSVLARAHSEVRAGGNPAAQAALVALGRVPAGGPERDLVLVSTLEPTVLTTGAAIAAGVDLMIFGLPSPLEDNARRVRPSGTGDSPLPRLVGGLLPGEVRALLDEVARSGEDGGRAAQARRFLQPPGG